MAILNQSDRPLESTNQSNHSVCDTERIRKAYNTTVGNTKLMNQTVENNNQSDKHLAISN